MTSVTSNGKAVTTKRIFSRETAVSIDIQADKSIIWALLTNISDIPRWNSTIISIDGNMSKGEKIRLKSKLDPNREFKLTVKEILSESHVVWGDAMGKRIYTLKTIGNNLTNFSMVETIGGPLFPLFAKMIPSFDATFEQYVLDLKNEAEAISIDK
jgi:hypothetical protein